MMEVKMTSETSVNFYHLASLIAPGDINSFRWREGLDRIRYLEAEEERV
jgi:hypothetical protein